MAVPRVFDKLDQLIETSEKYDTLKRDFRVDVAHLRFVGTDSGMKLRVPDQNEADLRRNRGIWQDYTPLTGMAGFERPPLSFVDEPAEFRLDDNGRNAIYQKLAPIHWQDSRGSGTIPADFLAQFSDHDRADILNLIKNEAPSGKSWMIRTFGDATRAVLDGNYPRTWNTEILRATREVLSEGYLGNHPVMERATVTADSTYIRIFWDNSGEDAAGGLRVGVLIANGETGNSATRLMPMVWRTSCTNSIAIDQTNAGRVGVTIPHIRSRSPRVMMTQFVEQFPEVMEVSGSAIQRVLETQEFRVPDFEYVLEGLRIEHNWSRSISYDVAAGAEKEETVFGLVNGVTYAAHQQDNAETEFSLERLGGKLLYATPNYFDHLRQQGKAGKRIRAYA